MDNRIIRVNNPQAIAYVMKPILKSKHITRAV